LEESIMTVTAADVLIETLQHWGVEVVFGLPGFAQRALRRRARWSAGAGHHRDDLSRSDWYTYPARRGPRSAVRGRGEVQRAHHGAGPRRKRHRSSVPNRAGLSWRRPPHLPGGYAGNEGARSSVIPQRGS